MSKWFSRETLIHIMKVLSDLQHQKQIWGDGKILSDEMGSYDDLMHFLLDDTELSDYPQVEIGHMLKDENEALLVYEVTRKILEVFNEVGNARMPHVYLDHAKWIEVVVAAKRAYDTLTSENTPN